MSERLPKNSVNTDDVIEHRIEYDQGNVELFFLELLQSGFNVVFELIVSD